MTPLGSERLVGTRYGPNTPLAFDGLRLLTHTKRAKVSLLALRPVEAGRANFDDRSARHRSLWGVYTTWSNVEAYYLGYRNSRARFVDGSGAEADGVYRWSYQDGQEGEFNSLTVKNVYWLSQGAKTVKLEFTPSGESCTSSATGTVNVVLPVVESYSAYQTNASIHPGGGCASFGGSLGQNAFQLGCGASQPGIKFDATVKGPSDLISIPGDSRIKFVQFFNSFATAHSSSGYECASTRGSEYDTSTGWRRDGPDPYGLVPPVPFNQDGIAVHSAIDSPGYAIDTFDSFRNNDHFEMYLVYITGSSLNPRYQQVLSMVPWEWSGEIFFSSPGVWSSYTAYPQSQQRFGTTPNNRVYNPGDPTDIDWSSCSGGPSPDPTPDPTPDPCFRGGWDCGPVY
jgi:hypothetical protein